MTPTPTVTSTPTVTATPTVAITDPTPTNPPVTQPPSGPNPDPTTPSPETPQPPSVSPTPSNTPRPPAPTPKPAYDPPVGALRVAPVVSGSAATGNVQGFSAIEVLRGAPINLWVRANVEPPATDPAATVALTQWTLVRGANDRPGGTQPGASGGPGEPLRLQWNDVTPVVDGQLRPYELHLQARIRVTYGDGTTRDFDLEGSIAVTVRFQGATT